MAPWRLAGFLLIIIFTVSVVQLGCASAPHLPPPPAEELRSQSRAVTLSAGSADAEMLFIGPAKGALEGTWRGMRVGFVAPIAVGAALGGMAPLAGAAVIATAPVGAVIGGIVGAAAADPAAKVEEKEAVVRTTLTRLKMQEAFRDCVVLALRDQVPHVGVASANEMAPMTLEVVVEDFGLEGSTWSVNPPLRFTMTAQTRLIRADGGSELHMVRLAWQGQLRPLDEWVAQDGAPVQAEARRACRDLAEALVDEVFLLYLVAEGP